MEEDAAHDGAAVSRADPGLAYANPDATHRGSFICAPGKDGALWRPQHPHPVRSSRSRPQQRPARRTARQIWRRRTQTDRNHARPRRCSEATARQHPIRHVLAHHRPTRRHPAHSPESPKHPLRHTGNGRSRGLAAQSAPAHRRTHYACDGQSTWRGAEKGGATPIRWSAP